MSAQDKYSLQERGRFKAWWDAARPLEGSAFPYEIAWAAWQAALSAQPSPGGQGEALVTDAMIMAALQAVTRETLAGVGACDSKVIGVLTAYGIDGAVDIPTMVRAMLEEALAARQPVGEPVGYFDPDVLAHLTEGLIDPVGVLRRTPNGTSNMPVWLGPPAQAVDLGELREMLESWKNSDYPFSYEGQCAQRALDACIADLKGWLDSQAVGK